MIENPVFIVGTERSGSNLLRLLLNELPSLTIPHPPHLMRDLTPVISRYGDLESHSSFMRLIRDAVRLVELHFAPWGFELDADRILREASERDLYSVYASIYEQYLEHSGKKRWGCKSTFMIHHVDEILKHHKSPQFIHLVRDPRDVAVSARRSVFSHYHPYFVAKLWRGEQAKALAWSERLPRAAWLTVRYEDLTANPEAELRRICGFLGERYSSKMLKYFEKSAAQELSQLSRSWQNVGRPVLKNNSEKFRRELSAEDIRVIESVAFPQMERFHYELVHEPMQLHEKPSRLNQVHFRLLEDWMMLKEEGRALLLDRNARFRLRKRAYLLALKMGYLPA